MEPTRNIFAEIIEDLSLTGAKDLRGVVALVLEWDTDDVENLKLGVILEEFEKQTGRKAKTVSKSLTRIVAHIWQFANEAVLREIYLGHLPAYCPSPKSFIIRLVYFEQNRRNRMEGDKVVSL